MGDAANLDTIPDFTKFGISPVTGFCPETEPIPRLPAPYNAWEDVLDSAMELKLQRGVVKGLSEDEKSKSEAWRARVRELPLLPIEDLKASYPTLIRAHHVLAYLVHIYTHTLTTDAQLLIPTPISLPILRVSAELGLPPSMVYSDDVLNNWVLRNPPTSGVTAPTVDNLKMQTYFIGSPDEEEFYFAATRVEIRGGEALRIAQDVLRRILASSEDKSALQSDISSSLQKLVPIINEMRELALNVRGGCKPDFFYRELRPWLLGGDADPNGRKWIFEGIETDPSLEEPTELSGSSAAQSPLIQALDIFFGITQLETGGPSTSFAKRMRAYMTKPQRGFLEYLAGYSHVLRDFVEKSGNSELTEAYNQAVLALKEFRDGHMIIITLYVIQPARRLAREEAESAGVEATKAEAEKEKELKGSAGGDLAKLLKDYRDKTTGSVLQ